VSSTVVVAQEVPVAEAKFTDTVIRQTTDFVVSTVNLFATPFMSDRDIECMARNIYYESGSEPTEGKVAVGIVTLNRVQDGRFGRDVCEVVKSRTVVVKQKTVTKTKMVKIGYFGTPQPVEQQKTIIQQVPVCQFSWTCGGLAQKPKPSDERWIESQAIAQKLAQGEYQDIRSKYARALYFHAAGVRPIWAKTKDFVARTGHHLFYN
jgi:spore germination cell wall hydrolase CwlJ-like protein